MTEAAPPTVGWAYLLWIGAVVTAIIEVLVRFATAPEGFSATIEASGEEVAVRLAAYAILITLATLMRRGRGFARHALLVIFGGLGLFSLVFEPVQWVADGGDVSAFLSQADAATWVMILSRIAHIASVILAIVLGYAPSANAWFNIRNAGRTASSY